MGNIIRKHVLLAVMLFVQACCIMAQNATEMVTFKTDSLSLIDKTGEYKIVADLPVNANSILTKAIGEFIAEELGNGHPDNANTLYDMMRHSFDLNVKALHMEQQEISGEDGDGPLFAWESRFNAVCVADNFVTYRHEGYIYTGGAHGLSSHTGMTFRKDDGRRIGWDLFRNTNAAGFQRLMKEGLKSYFNVDTDEELNTCGLIDLTVVPLPACSPLFTEKGVLFIYQPYEIACYAAGAPEFVIPYEKLIPYLGITAKKLIGVVP